MIYERKTIIMQRCSWLFQNHFVRYRPCLSKVDCSSSHRPTPGWKSTRHPQNGSVDSRRTGRTFSQSMDSRSFSSLSSSCWRFTGFPLSSQMLTAPSSTPTATAPSLEARISWRIAGKDSTLSLRDKEDTNPYHLFLFGLNFFYVK